MQEFKICLFLAILLLWGLLWIVLVVGVFFGNRLRRYPFCQKYARLCTALHGRRGRSWILLFAVASSILLGCIGLWRECTHPNEYVLHNVIWVFYRSINHLIMGNNADGWGKNLFTQMATISSIACYMLILYEAMLRLFTNSLQRLELKLTKNHTVICGLGYVGIMLAQEAVEENQPVVVIEIDANNPNIRKVEEQGVTVVIGDATDKQMLRWVNATAALELVIAMNTDELNLECTANFHKIETEAQDKAGHKGLFPQQKHIETSVFVHLRQPKLRHLVEKYNDEDSSAYLYIYFNVIERASHQLLTKLVLPYRPRVESQVAHFVVIGFDAVGQQLVRDIANFAHYENLKRPRLTVVYRRGEAAAVRAFRRAHPRLMLEDDEVTVGTEFFPEPERDDWMYEVRRKGYYGTAVVASGNTFAVNGTWFEDEGGALSQTIADHLVSIHQGENGVLPIVVVCHADEDANYTSSRRLREVLNQRLGIKQGDVGPAPVPIFAYVPCRPMLTHEDAEALHGLHFLGDYKDVCLLEDLKNDHSVALAIDLAFDYAQRHDPDSIQGRTSIPYFRSRDAWSQNSNLMAAAFAPIKLAALVATEGRADDEQVLEIKWEEVKGSPEQPHPVMVMEHNRWSAERLATGWKWTPEKKKDETQFINPDLVPWKYLGEEQKKDSEQIEAILKHIQTRFDNKNEDASNADNAPTA